MIYDLRFKNNHQTGFTAAPLGVHGFTPVPRRVAGPACRQAGFTLVEVLLAAALLTLVMLISFGVWRFLNSGAQLSLSQANAVADAEQTSARIIREIRELQEAENGAYALVTAGDQELAFYADTDSDGEAERLRYWLEGTMLKRGVIEPLGSPVTYPTENEAVRIVTSNVANGAAPLFAYYNGEWPVDTANNPLAPASRLLLTRMLTVNLIIQVPSAEAEVPVTVRKATALRAIKNN